MTASTISPLNYSFDTNRPINWTATQEKSISREYPFPGLQDETPDHFIARTYLQFLWLPESIMPLNLLVPSLLRVKIASTSDPASDAAPHHPLHTLLDPLILTVRSVSNKYRVELPQILADGGGAGEMEEEMMWFALNHEQGGDRRGEECEGEVWTDEKWRASWLERLERREIQIQILLYFLKLSLPGPPPPIPVSSSSPSPRKGKRQPGTQLQPVVPSTEERLESFMDKLSMWQLLSGLDEEQLKEKENRKEEHDWMQVFCENIVEPRFKTQLPELCLLLRNKVFPNSPFSDDESVRTVSRSPSPSPTMGIVGSRKNTSRSNSTRPHQDGALRSRSRSLSVTLAQDAEARRAGSATIGKKKVLNREVSMSRVFKAKTKSKGGGDTKNRSRSMTEYPKRGSGSKDEGITLVEATPVKGGGKSRSTPATLSSRVKSTGGGLFGKGIKEEEDEIWDIPSSPDILLLEAGSDGAKE